MNTQERIYFDNAASTPLDTSVLDNNVLSNNQSVKGKGKAISIPQAIKILNDINKQ